MYLVPACVVLIWFALKTSSRGMRRGQASGYLTEMSNRAHITPIMLMFDWRFINGILFVAGWLPNWRSSLWWSWNSMTRPSQTRVIVFLFFVVFCCFFVVFCCFLLLFVFQALDDTCLNPILWNDCWAVNWSPERQNTQPNRLPQDQWRTWRAAIICIHLPWNCLWIPL